MQLHDHTNGKRLCTAQRCIFGDNSSGNNTINIFYLNSKCLKSVFIISWTKHLPWFKQSKHCFRINDQGHHRQFLSGKSAKVVVIHRHAVTAVTAFYTAKCRQDCSLVVLTSRGGPDDHLTLLIFII